jgi:hypothetical protein
MITAGTYKAKVQGECVLGEARTGSAFIQFYLTIIEGDHKGERVRWAGYFTENTNERSIKALQTCGWQGDDLAEFVDGQLHGLDANDVEIVVELEPYDGPNEKHQGKSFPKVAWINRSGGILNTAAKMSPDAAAAFGAKMRGLVRKVAVNNPVPNPKPNATTAPAATPVAEVDDGIPF